MIYHIAKKRKASRAVVIFKCDFRFSNVSRILRFYALRQQKVTQLRSPIKTANLDSDDITNEIDDANHKEELRLWHYLLVDSEIERARHKVFNYAIENLIAKIVD